MNALSNYHKTTALKIKLLQGFYNAVSHWILFWFILSTSDHQSSYIDTANTILLNRSKGCPTLRSLSHAKAFVDVQGVTFISILVIGLLQLIPFFRPFEVNLD